MLTWGIFAGALLLFGSIGSLGRAQNRWMERWFRPWRLGGEAGFIKRVRLALSRKNHVYMFPLLGPLLAMAAWIGAVQIFGISIPLGFVQGMMIGYAGAAVLAYPIDLTKAISNYRRHLAIFAAQKLARRARPEIANEILVPLTQNADPSLRMAAAMGLRELGTKEGGEALRLLGEDADSTVASAARDAYNDLRQVYLGVGRLSVRTMDTFVEEHRYLAARLKGKTKDAKFAAEREKLEEITKHIDDVVFSQLPLRRAFPDVYCKDCNSRGEHRKYGEWDWVRCRQCHEVHGLQPGVMLVIGQIGGEGERHLQDGTLHLNLWDEAAHKGSPAEIDVLEVLGGKDIHYDWAVSAVVDKLLNHGIGANGTIKVRIVGEVPLELNSLHLLKSLDPSVVVGG